MNGTRISQLDFLRKRNALWRDLRALEPKDQRVDVLMTELMQLTKWSRDQVLEGLGWIGAELT